MHTITEQAAVPSVSLETSATAVNVGRKPVRRGCESAHMV